MPGEKSEQPKSFVVPRKGETDLKFRGELLAEVCEHLGTLPFERDYALARIHRTLGGNYVATYAVGDGDKESVQRAAKCLDAAEIRSFYTIPPSSGARRNRSKKEDIAFTERIGHLMDIGKRVLEEAGKVDSKLKDSHLEEID